MTVEHWVELATAAGLVVMFWIMLRRGGAG